MMIDECTVFVFDDGIVYPSAFEVLVMDDYATAIQREMWARHGDDVIGVPEVEPDCNDNAQWLRLRAGLRGRL